MKDNPVSESVTDLVDSIKSYGNAQFELLKLNFIEKAATGGTMLILGVIVGFLGVFVLLMLTFSFCFWYANNIGTLSQAFLIAAAFYILLGIALVALRKQILTNSIVKALSGIILKDKKNGEQASHT